jgi:serine/threonine-protein kinase
MKKCPQCGKEYQDTNSLCPTDGTVLVKAGDGLIGQTLASKYRIEELINEGGMGAVYRGTHILMDKTVAVKVLHPSLAADDKIVARFSREAKAASRISHPHALNVTDFGEDEGGIVFLVMEYLRGKTLKEVIHEDGPMPLSRAVEIIRQVCGALEAAHTEGVVHRDLKSDNIMLVDINGGGDWAKVLDFGIAKITEKVGQDPGLTAPNLIIGTPQYMSPEQCSQASEIDSRSDIYSLGIIIYEMLAGHVPFTGESPTAIMMKHLQDAPPSILEERKDLPASVGRVVAHALAKRPEDRFQTVSELSDNLALAAEDPATPMTTSPGASDRDTNRIVVPTGSNEPPRDTANDDYDETTVVRPRVAATTDEPEMFRDEIAPPPPSVNLWKIIIPAVAGLVVLFGVIYALTGRNSTQSPANSNSTLTVDPGAQPVQAAPPVTGKSEQGINPNAPVTTINSNTQPGAPTEAAPAPTAGEQPANANANKNRNANQSQNDNTGAEADETPTPTPAKNSNKQDEPPNPPATPTPKKDTDEPPPPSPTPTQKQKKPRPATSPSDNAPQTPPATSTPSR